MNQIMKMLSQKSPIISALKQGGSPQKIVMQMMQTMGPQNNMFSQMINMANNGQTRDLENMARQIFTQNGRSFDSEFTNFKNMINEPKKQ